MSSFASKKLEMSDLEHPWKCCCSQENVADAVGIFKPRNQALIIFWKGDEKHSVPDLWQQQHKAVN